MGIIASHQAGGSTPQRIFLEDMKGDIRGYWISDIVYFQAAGNKARVILKENRNKIVINESFISLEKRLPSPFFFRIHRQYIVNFNFISIYNEPIVRLESTPGKGCKNFTDLPVARQRREGFRAWLGIR